MADTTPPLAAAPQPVALVIGAGDATGGAIAQRFAREGYVACVTRRSADKLQPLVDTIRAAGGQAHGFASDARQEEEVVALVDRIEREIGPIEVLVFNIGANVPCSILEETARKYFKIWEMACFSGFLNAREVTKRQVARGRGTILFTGASAGVKGFPQSAPFAMGKFAQRGLAQSMSRELHPKGIHVAWINIDGMIRNPGRSEPADNPDSMLDPDAIARTYLALVRQDRSAWSEEIAVRPWVEKF